MRIRCPECETLMAVKGDNLPAGKRAQVTCRCGQRLRFKVPDRPAPDIGEVFASIFGASPEAMRMARERGFL